MSRSWSIGELWQQLSASGWHWAQSVSRSSQPQRLLLGLTLAFMALAGALESPLLFLLAVGQGVILFRFRQSECPATMPTAEAHNSAWMESIGQWVPETATIRQTVGVVGTVLYRSLMRGLVCLSIATAVGLATLSWFALNQPELWQWRTLDTSGPPLGAVLVTGLATLLSLLTTSWIACRRPLLPTRERC